MALIICPECGKEISNQAKQCIHCGYPLSENTQPENNICMIDGVPFDFTDYLNEINASPNPELLKEPLSKRLFGNARVSLFDAYNIVGNLIATRTAPKTFHYESPIKNRNILTCPKCGSTAIATGQRGWKWSTGFLGSSKTVNRCGNCGHTWRPGK